jgi:hypothetical protein
VPGQQQRLGGAEQDLQRRSNTFKKDFMLSKSKIPVIVSKAINKRISTRGYFFAENSNFRKQTVQYFADPDP